jgi:tetratricopeptide (TPR) repeat protein
MHVWCAFATLLPAVSLGAVDDVLGDLSQDPVVSVWLVTTRSRTPSRDAETEQLAKAADVALTGLQWDKAGELYSQALARLRATTDSAPRADVLYDLAVVSREQKHLQSAAAHLKEAMSLYEQLYGADSPQLAIARAEQAEELTKTGQWAQAEQLLRDAVVMLDQQLGPENPTAANETWLLAVILDSEQHYKEAESYYRQVLQIHQHEPQPKPMEVSLSLYGLGRALYGQKKFGEVLEPMKQALGGFERILSAQDLLIADAASIVGSSLLALGQPREAEPYLRRAWNITNSYTEAWAAALAARVGNNLAYLLRAVGKPLDAETILRQTIPLWDRLNAPGAQTANSVDLLGAVLLDQHRPKEAEPYLRRATSLREASLGDDFYTAESELNLANALMLQAQFSAALTPMTRALAIQQKVFGYNDARTAEETPGRTAVSLAALRRSRR